MPRDAPARPEDEFDTRAADSALTVTALVLDKDDQVLEVLTGVPDVDESRTSANAIETGESRPFRLASPMPIGRAAVTVRVYPEVLPGARPGAVP